MSSIYAYPQETAGDAQAQLVALRRYLRILVNQLNMAATAGTAEAEHAAGTAVERTAKQEAERAAQSAAAELKELIRKNADRVQQEIDSLEAELHGSYVAESEFGTFQEEVDARFTAMPDAIRQDINYDALIESITGLENYRIETEGYIKSGIVDWDGAIPIIGIAIGQDLRYTSTQRTVDGKAYTEIDKRNFSSVFTASRLAFYIGNTCVAYFSNNALYITDATVTGKLYFSGRWVVDHSAGLTIKWIGGD